MRTRVLLLVAAVVAAGCSPAVPEAEPFLGVWASEGWGIILDVHGGDADIYEVSSAQCLLATAGSARNIDDVVSLEGERLVLDDGGRVIRFDRLAGLPDRCTQQHDSSPAAVLSTVVAVVEEQYYPGVDAGWSQRVASLDLASIGDADALAAAIEALLGPLADPQLALQTETDLWSAGPHGIAAELATALTDGTLLPGATIAGAGGLVAAELDGGIGYLGFLRLGGFADGEDDSQRVLAAALDHVLDGATGAILNLRATTSGTATEALLVATRFVSAGAVVATYQAQLADGTTVAAGDAVVNPMPTGPFPGGVVVLVGPDTSGPAELLALALAELPGVTIIGEPTAGSPRSPLVRGLPNGWLLGIPNTAVTMPDGIQRVGVPLVPDVTAPLTSADIAAGRDPGLDAALVVLGG